jgi:ribosomal protein L7/L12
VLVTVLLKKFKQNSVVLKEAGASKLAVVKMVKNLQV